MARHCSMPERTPDLPQGGVARLDGALALAPAAALAVGAPLPEQRAAQRPAGAQALGDSPVHRPAGQVTCS